MGGVRPTMEKLNRKAELANTTDIRLGGGLNWTKQAFQCMKITPKVEARLLLKTCLVFVLVCIF